MTASIKEVRVALADAVGTIDGLHAIPTIRNSANPPEAHVYRKAFTYDDVQHGPDEYGAHTFLLGVRVYLSHNNDEAGQDLLDELTEPVGDKSIKQAVESDDALRGVCDWVLVTETGEPEIVTFGAIDYLSQDFTVQVGVS